MLKNFELLNKAKGEHLSNCYCIPLLVVALRSDDIQQNVSSFQLHELPSWHEPPDQFPEQAVYTESHAWV